MTPLLAWTAEWEVIQQPRSLKDGVLDDQRGNAQDGQQADRHEELRFHERRLRTRVSGTLGGRSITAPLAGHELLTPPYMFSGGISAVPAASCLQSAAHVSLISGSLLDYSVVRNEASSALPAVQCRQSPSVWSLIRLEGSRGTPRRSPNRQARLHHPTTR